MLKFRQFIEEQEKKKKSGAGEIGTDELTKTYVKDTPGQEQLDEGLGKVLDLFIQTYKQYKNKPIGRIVWGVSQTANMNYHALVKALEAEAKRGALPNDIVKALKPEFEGQKRRSNTLKKISQQGFNPFTNYSYR